ncbi:MAG: IclR family transcriptional regulator [Rhodospirillaceae bacterium]
MADTPDGVAAVDRALAILDAYTETDDRLTLAELAKRTGFYKSTLLRLASSLERRGYLVRLEDRSWRLGPAASRLGSIYLAAFNLGDVVEPVLQSLAAKTGETASFNVRDGDVRVCLYRVESQQRLRDHVRQGEVLPLDRGAGGKVLLAFGGAAGELFDRIRAAGVYTAFGERDPGLGGISSPVFGARGVLAGVVTISFPVSRLDRDAATRLESVVRAHADEISMRLGGRSANNLAA